MKQKIIISPARVFSRKEIARNSNFSVTKSFRCTVEMWQAIETLAIREGLTPNGYIALVLDIFLQEKVRTKEIKAPNRKKQTTVFL